MAQPLDCNICKTPIKDPKNKTYIQATMYRSRAVHKKCKQQKKKGKKVTTLGQFSKA